MTVEKKVGIFFLVGLAILILLFELVGKETLFARTITVKSYFTSIAQLRVGDPVKVAGVEVGTVRDIRIAAERPYGGKVEVVMRVRKGAPIKTDSVATIKLTSLLGTSYVDFTIGSPEKPLIESGMVLDSLEPPDLNTLLASVNDAAGDIRLMVSNMKESLGDTFDAVSELANKLGKGEGTIGKLISDDAVYRDLRAVMADAKAAGAEIKVAAKSINRIARQIEKGEGTLGKLVSDDSLYQDVRTIAADLRSVSAEIKVAAKSINRIARQIEKGEGTLGKLVSDDSFYKEAKEAFSGLSRMSKKIQDGQGTLGKLVNDDSLYQEMRSTIESVNSIVKKVERGEGTLGKLVNDDSLYFSARDSLKKVGKGADQLREQGPLTVIGLGLGQLF